MHIESIKVRNRSHVEDVGSGHDGYFFCKGAGALLFQDLTVHTFNIGHIENGKLYVRTWRLPELSPERFEERSLYDTPHECLITKKGTLDGQKLQAQTTGQVQRYQYIAEMVCLREAEKKVGRPAYALWNMINGKEI